MSSTSATIGIVAVAICARLGRVAAARDDHIDLPVNQTGGETRPMTGIAGRETRLIDTFLAARGLNVDHQPRTRLVPRGHRSHPGR